MPTAFAWHTNTLKVAETIVAGIDPQRFLSKDGPKLLKLIDCLAVDTTDSSIICQKLVEIGASRNWDMPNMNATQEKSFLKWLVDMRLGGAT